MIQDTVDLVVMVAVTLHAFVRHADGDSPPVLFRGLPYHEPFQDQPLYRLRDAARRKIQQPGQFLDHEALGGTGHQSLDDPSRCCGQRAFRHIRPMCGVLSQV